MNKLSYRLKAKVASFLALTLLVTVIPGFAYAQKSTAVREGGLATVVNVVNNGPSASPIAAGSVNNVLLNYSVTPNKDLLVENTQLRVSLQDEDSNPPIFNANNSSFLDVYPVSGDGVPCWSHEYELNLITNEADMLVGDMLQLGNMFARVTSNDGDTSNGGLCVSSSSDLTQLATGTIVTEVNPYDYVQNILIKNADTGLTLAGSLAKASDADYCTGVNSPLTICPGMHHYAVNFLDNYNLDANLMLNLSVQADLGHELVEGYHLAAAVQYPGQSIYDPASGQFVDPADLTNAGLTAMQGNFMNVITQGSLSIASEGNPASAIRIDGSVEQSASKYKFTALEEAFEVKKLTIVNDLEGSFGDEVQPTIAVESVTIKYADENGVQQSRTAALSGNGSATFSGLDFYVPAGTDSFLDVFANLRPIANVGQELSGTKYRLGLRNTENNPNTFLAIGQTSSFSVFDPTIFNSDNVNEFVVRKSAPVFSNISASSLLTNGENTLMNFAVTADAGGAISLARMVFELNVIDADAGAELDLANIKLYKSGSLIDADDLNFYAVSSSSTTALGNNMAVGSGNSFFMNPKNDRLVVTFDREQVVNAGSSVNFSLKASVSGVEVNDRIITGLANGDENSEIDYISSGNSCGPAHNEACSNGNGFGNTGRLSDGTVGEALFDRVNSGTHPSIFGFSRSLGSRLNMIWTDRSTESYLYPYIVNGIMNNGAGSPAFTNGHLLKLSELLPHTLEN